MAVLPQNNAGPSVGTNISWQRNNALSATAESRAFGANGQESS